MTLSRRILSILALSLFTIGLWAQETGKADVFSDEFQGSWTASKTKYNKDEFVAAHKSYEFGTILKVMVAGGEKAINVRVVDRGPFKFGYVVTLSRAAANELGIKEDDPRDVVIMVAREQGLATTAPATVPTATFTQPNATQQTTTIVTNNPVNTNPNTQIITTTTTPSTATTYSTPTTTITQPEQEFASKGQAENIEVGATYSNVVVTSPAETVVISKPAETVVMTSSNLGFGLQVGSFLDYNNAVIEMNKLKSNNINNLLVNSVRDNTGKLVYKLVIGPYAVRSEVEQYKAINNNNVNKDAFIVDLSKMK